MACTHDEFDSSVVVTPIPQPAGLAAAYLVQVHVWCKACQTSPTFALPPAMVLPVGLGTGYIRDAEQSEDGTEARLRAQMPLAAIEIPDEQTPPQAVTTEEGL